MDQHNTPNQGAPVPPYEANPAYTQQPAIQHHDSYNSAPIQPYHGQQQSYPPQGPQHTPMSSPPLASEQKHEYYPNQQSQPGIPHQQQQHQQPVQLQQMQHPSQSGYQTAVPLANLQEAAAPVDCPSCRMRALTRTEYHSGGTTNAWAAIICLCFCLGCIPYLINGLKDVEHKCGHCGVLLATWHKSGRTVVHSYT